MISLALINFLKNRIPISVPRTRILVRFSGTKETAVDPNKLQAPIWDHFGVKQSEIVVIYVQCA